MVTVGSFLIFRRTGPETQPGYGAGPPKVTVPCLSWVPVLGSLPWLRGRLPLHLLFTQLSYR